MPSRPWRRRSSAALHVPFAPGPTARACLTGCSSGASLGLPDAMATGGLLGDGCLLGNGYVLGNGCLSGNGADGLADDQVDPLGQRGVEVVRGHDRNTVLKGQRLDVLLELADVVEEVEVALERSVARLERPDREMAAGAPGVVAPH